MLPIIYHLFFDLCGSATKCMTGNSFCEMRRCVYNSTQMLCLMASMDHSLQKMTGGLALILRSSWSRDIFLRALYTSLCVKEISCVKNRLGCRNLRRHSQLQTWWTHVFFFFALSISSLLARLPCLAASLSACPHVPAKELFIILVSVDLCWTKRMTGKSLCEMRGCVYISTQM